MREIKFRFWLDTPKWPRLKQMLSWEEVGRDMLYFVLESHYQAMQFTGLSDKYNREIWEGDIIADTLGRRYVVEWSGVGWNPFVDNMIDSCKSYRFKVLGNIHENPELLEDIHVS